MLDVGIGYGWHWYRQENPEGRKIVGLDLSLGNLLLAQKILGRDDPVLLICADASRLPLRDASLSGAWSVQTVQHFPEAVFDAFHREIDRVLQPRCIMDVYNLNPALMYRLAYRLLGRRLHGRGRIGAMELNRFPVSQWMARWRGFRPGRVEIRQGYSELFFHPEFYCKPKNYPVRLEQKIAAGLPGLASLFARQGQLCFRPLC